MQCKNHPKYSGKRRPKTDCQFCTDLWNFKSLNASLGSSGGIHKFIASNMEPVEDLLAEFGIDYKKEDPS